MNHGKSEKKPKRKCLSDLVSPHLLVCVALAATCAALVVVILQMDRRISTLEELRREGKQASTANNSATVPPALDTRAKRAISNTTPGQKSDIEKRLKAVEERRVKRNQIIIICLKTLPNLCIRSQSVSVIKE